MQVSKKSWHYRFNSQLQGSSFRDRVGSRKYTTCTYIRTTLRSIAQAGLYTFLGLLALSIVLIIFANMIYVPLAAIVGWDFAKGMVGVCIVGWFWATVLVCSLAWNTHKARIKKLLGAREARNLTLLEQRIKDGKEGICTIVEVV